MRRLVLTVFLLAGAGVGATEIYRWVDSDGVVHFTDRPVEGAERLELEDPQTISPPVPRTRRSARSSEADEGEPAPGYQSLEILEPGQEEVLWNIEGRLDVSMRLDPKLQEGDRVSLYLDDQKMDLNPGSLRARLTGVGRGAHVLTAEVRSPRGTVLIRSEPRRFVVQQTSVLNPNNPANAPVPTPLRR